MGIQFIDLKAQRKRLKSQIDAGIQAVMEHGAFIMGPEVREFEKQLAEFGQAKHALGCANGTDALVLSLMALGVGEGDAVFCPSFTYCASAEGIANVGATPVFVDVCADTYNMDVESLKQAIIDINETAGLSPKAIMAVDIFGQAADYRLLSQVAQAEGLKLIADSAQGFGSTIDGNHPLNWADITTTSFFPAKPLGCYGDGGAVLTNDDQICETVDSLRIHGKGEHKYDNVRIGMNSRLDTMQAAILLPKLSVFADEIEKRNAVAQKYHNALHNQVERVPTVLEGGISTWAQYTIEVSDWLRLATQLKEKGIPTARYYPNPVHGQSAYKHFPVVSSGLPQTEACLDKIISLPMHPYLEEDVQNQIIEAVIEAVN
ncbi:DegT/DnrJ/EryC1/StrS family aminotransferase [Hirschia maritima]|uniref:DegT/DnrJ/EryC1/StrS family aminotransferase n=1 Tax=Hirschia maritima TaxID=1121961 RepID=UPI000374F8FB|nr:DegT/DnrJ/EryC1/StrS aminotransferase family protein [Hirschia maritima]